MQGQASTPLGPKGWPRKVLHCLAILRGGMSLVCQQGWYAGLVCSKAEWWKLHNGTETELLAGGMQNVAVLGTLFQSTVSGCQWLGISQCLLHLCDSVPLLFHHCDSVPLPLPFILSMNVFVKDDGRVKSVLFRVHEWIHIMLSDEDANLNMYTYAI